MEKGKEKEKKQHEPFTPEKTPSPPQEMDPSKKPEKKDKNNKGE